MYIINLLMYNPQSSSITVLQLLNTSSLISSVEILSLQMADNVAGAEEEEGAESSLAQARPYCFRRSRDPPSTLYLLAIKAVLARYNPIPVCTTYVNVYRRCSIRKELTVAKSLFLLNCSNFCETKCQSF